MSQTLSMPRQLVRLVLSLAMAAVIAVNHLTSSLVGVLVLLLVLYFGIPALSHVEFWSMQQTLDWALSLPADTLLAAGGIVAAYAIAVVTWRQQKAYEIRLESTRAVAQFLHEFADLAKTIEDYASRLAALDEKAATVPGLARASAESLLEDRGAFLDARARLSRKFLEIHEVRSRFEMVVAGSFVPDMALIAAEKSISAIGLKVWFPIPVYSETPEDLIVEVRRLSQKEWVEFSRLADRWVPALSAAANALVAIAHGRLFRPTLWSAWRTYRRSEHLLRPRD